MFETFLILKNVWIVNFNVLIFCGFVLFFPHSAYEHAVLAAGIDFRSDRLWESYITWETEQQKLAHVTAIYDRILAIPTQLYSQHFQRSGSKDNVVMSEVFPFPCSLQQCH